MIQSIIVYFGEKGQEIAIGYILGISRIKWHFTLICFNLLSYIGIIIGSIKLDMPLMDKIAFVICFILFELFLETIIIRYFENNKLINWLKGEK